MSKNNKTSAGVTETIARFITNSSLLDIPEVGADKARKSLVDTFGVTLAGAVSEVAAPLLSYVRQSGAYGDSVVLGTGIKASAEAAALINGTFAHALDFDDVLSLMVAHPSSTIVAALLAATGSRKVSGGQFLEAYILGVEIGAKIGAGMTVGHFGRGFHPQGTLCIFAAVAALAKLNALDMTTTQTAFGIAGSLASGLRRNIGTMTKPLHAGWAARSAVAAIDLARCGFTAALDIMEAKTGFVAVYGVESSDLGLACEALGNPWAIMDPGLALKRFPCCYASHRGMDGVLTLRRKMKFSAETLALLECRYPPGSTVSISGYPRPQTGLEGKFSLEYSLAAGVLDGGYTLATFTDEGIDRPAIHQLLEKIRIREDSRCGDNDALLETRSISGRGFVEVEVTMTNGDKDMVRVDHAPGHPKREIAWEEIQAKFMDCAAYSGIQAPKAEAAFGRIRDIDHCDDMREISNLLRVV